MAWKKTVALSSVVGLLATPAIAQSTVSLEAGAVFQDCADCPEMVVVGAGSFTMGFDGGVSEVRYDGPPREVTIENAFAIGRYELTQAQYRAFVEDTGHVSGTDCRAFDGTNWAKRPGKDWTDPGYGRPPLDNDPVACVSWHDSKAYVAWLAEQTGQPYRLPTESEWEYAARAGTDTIFIWGDDQEAGCEYANYLDQSASQGVFRFNLVACNDGHPLVAPVGSLKPNAFGLYDTTGNLWEWLEDCYLVPYDVQPTDGSAYQVEGQCAQRAVRGGSWHAPPTWQRTSFRGRDEEELVTQGFGFRIVRDLQ